MKQNKLFKLVLVLMAVLTFSNCEENGPIQFVVSDEFPTTVTLNNLEGQTSFSISNQETDISGLLDNASSFVEAEVESVRVKLNSDFSGEAINGNLMISVGSLVLINQNVNMTKSFSEPIVIPAASSNILSLISSGSFPVSISGTASEAIPDNAFTADLEFKIKATVE